MLEKNNVSEEPKMVKEIAAALGFSVGYVYAIKQGTLMPDSTHRIFISGRARVDDVEEWLKLNTWFKKRKVYSGFNFGSLNNNR